MKIAFVLDDSLDVPDGVQQYILRLGEEFSRRDHEVHYLVGDTVRTDIPHVHVLSHNLSVKFNQNRMRTPLPASRSAIRALLARERFDVVHVQAPYSPFLAGRIVSAVPPRTPVVATWHIAANSRLVEVGNRALALLNRRTLGRLDRSIAVSTAAADFTRAAYGLETTVIPCPIDLSHFAGATPDRTPGWKRIVFLGRLVGRKGPDRLLKGIEYAENNSLLPENTRVVIGGDGTMRRELEEFAGRLRTPVEFVGTVTEEPKPGFLAGADVAVFPALAGETFGIVLTEAMAAGAGVVLAGDNPGYRSTMAGNEDLLFDVDDPRALAERIRRALTSEEFAREAHAWQTEHVRQFDLAEVAARVLDFYGV